MRTEELLDRLLSASIGGCSCGTKPPDPQFHNPECHYRLHEEASQEIRRLMGELAVAEGVMESLQNKWASRPLSDPDLLAENERLRGEIEKAKVLLVDAPLADHLPGEAETKPDCETCQWMERMNVWYMSHETE